MHIPVLDTTTLNRVQISEARSSSETFGTTSEGRDNLREFSKQYSLHGKKILRKILSV